MIDQRIIKVGIEVNGKLHEYESSRGFRISGSGSKSANATQNSFEATITGLNRETRDYLITETSPFNESEKPKRLWLSAGRASTGYRQIFIGDIVASEHSDPPDLDIVIKAKTGAHAATRVVTRTGEAKTNLSDIASMVSEDIGASLDFQATDKLIANYNYTGGAYGQVGMLATSGSVRAYLDDGSLIVHDRDRPADGRIRILRLDTGMVGTPKITAQGVDVQYLIDGHSDIGGYLRIDSQFNPAADGDYMITKLGIDVASHGDEFFYSATASRL